jgi:hypothetical protein
MSNLVRLDPDQALGHLRKGDFSPFVGCVEWVSFECKKSPYQLKQSDQRFELAKDVAAMANAGGGAIVIGLGTEARDSGATEVVNDVRPFGPQLVDVRQVLDILNEWLYPPVLGVEVVWYPSSEDKEKGLVCIHVPSAPEDERPILVAKTLSESGGTRGSTFAWFERLRDGTTHWNVARLHAAIRSGTRGADVVERLTALQASLDAMAAPKVPSLARVLADGSLTNISEVGLANEPAYVLEAVPLGPVSAPNFFSSRRSPFAELVSSPPEIRSGGFGIDAGLNPRMREAYSWRAIEENSHRLLELGKDGRAKFAAPGDDSFLCWANKAPQRPLINPIVLIESIYLFAEFLHRLQSMFQPLNVGYAVTIRLYKLKSGSRVTCLPPGAIGSFWRARAVKEASAEYFSADQEWASGEIEPEVFAFRCVVPVYEWFGFTHDDIPYVKDLGSAPAIDIEQIRNARG